MPTVANLENVDLHKYKIVRQKRFVFSGMQTGRDECIRIGLFNGDVPVLISPAYTTFGIKQNCEVMPEYIYIQFLRKEMDRRGWFLSDSSIRANLDWNRFIDIQIPVPSSKVQRKVVEAWQGLRRMKEENEKLAEPLMQLCRSYLQECKKKYPMAELGEHILERNERNKEYAFNANDLQGVACTQNFIRSIAHTDGMDFGNHKIVRKGDFAYSNRINVGSIAYREDNDCIVSPSYTVFYIRDKQSLLPQFLSIWFARQEFFRATLFFAFGTIKDDFSYDNMARYKIPLPPIEVQQAIVDVYRCANEAKKIAEEADRLSREICPALVRWAAEGGGV